ncbi:heterokaryon incompatibility protein het-E-1 [Fusarium mundagurra]|uniref:Heterokaryon incompatibility protein het-E-1 n=1 Tax=Fusarium mundagurra TaxID=1567541 RepID=A0A8H5XUX2_9HYPO|nr:heterokaryon incompatibility protein het-E-1 [Fusarium mundagurra]
MKVLITNGPEGVQDNSDKDAGFLAALRSTDPSTDRTRIQQEKGGLLEDSYSWILDHADFRRWRDDEQIRLLWIKGDPGKGKTMLLCGITQELEKLPADTHCLSYFFCQATDERLNNGNVRAPRPPLSPPRSGAVANIARTEEVYSRRQRPLRGRECLLKIYDDKARDAVQHYLSSNSSDTFFWVALVCVSSWAKILYTLKLTDVQSRDFCSWLERTNPSRRHNDSCAIHEDNTGQWVLRASEWKRWVHGPKEFLWIHGIPGAGKTVLLSLLIQEVEAACKGRRQALVYYYCYFVNKQDETVPLLGWLISQLCRLSGKISDEMLQLFLRNHEPNIGQMLLSLEAILQEFDTVYLMIDAVDESLPRARLIQVIQDLATDQRFDKVRLLATSRNYTDIETVFSPISIQISMMNSLVEQDIRVYVHSSLRSNKKFARWSEDLLLEIEDTLSKGARGMFRWAACQISALQRLQLEHNVRIALKSLPKTLDEAYERVFLGILEEGQEIAQVAITLICGINNALI